MRNSKFPTTGNWSNILPASGCSRSAIASSISTSRRLVTESTAIDATWSDEDESFTGEILDMVTGLDSQMEITYLQ
jgi:hypothetical protein